MWKLKMRRQEIGAGYFKNEYYDTAYIQEIKYHHLEAENSLRFIAVE